MCVCVCFVEAAGSYYICKVPFCMHLNAVCTPLLCVLYCCVHLNAVCALMLCAPECCVHLIAVCSIVLYVSHTGVHEWLTMALHKEGLPEPYIYTLYIARVVQKHICTPNMQRIYVCKYGFGHPYISDNPCNGDCILSVYIQFWPILYIKHGCLFMCH